MVNLAGRILQYGSRAGLVSSFARFALFFVECNANTDVLLFQDAFSVFDPKQLRRKGKERHIFLFEQALLFSKETKDADGKIKYLYKSKIKVNAQLFVT